LPLGGAAILGRTHAAFLPKRLEQTLVVSDRYAALFTVQSEADLRH
jgi:hypothetical protein